MSRCVRLGTVVLAVGLLAAACGVSVDRDTLGAPPATDDFGPGGPDATDPDGTPTSVPTTLPPPDDVTIAGDTGAEVNQIAANAIRDLELYWGATYPEVFGGEPFEPLAGGYHAVNRNSRPSTLPCQPTYVGQVLNNAYFCPSDDAIAWDAEFLMPEMAEEYGDFVVAVVMAHEWGHAIQHRRDRLDDPTVVLELQADCYAGAWANHVMTSGTSRFEITTRDLDNALAGVLSLRDAPGAEATDPNAHGSGFDRVGAFQAGYEEGAGRCSTFTVDDPKPYQFEFADRESMTTSGTRAYDDIRDRSLASLEAYWADLFPALAGGAAWDPLEPVRAFDREDPPTCNGQPVTGYRLFLCVPDRYVGYDEETMAQAYDLGDFAVGTLFATQYGLEVQDQLQKPPGTEVVATLRGDCYTGAWAGALLPANQDPAMAERYSLTLNPGDLDEAVQVLLTFRTEADRERQGPGFARVRAFRTGALNGPGPCVDLQG